MASLLDNTIDPKFRIRDVSSTFTLARAEESPVVSMAKKGPKPTSTLYEFPFKTRHTPSDNAVADGKDVADGEIINNEANKHMLQARAQKGRVVIGVGDVAEELGNEYAVNRSLVADNVMDAVILAKENLEVTTLKNADSFPFVDNDNPMKLRGLTNWIRSANPATPDLPIPTAALTPAANIVASKAAATNVTEGDLTGVLRSIATTCRSMKNLHVFATPLMRQQISSFMDYVPTKADHVSVRNFNTSSKDKTIHLTVERIITDFGMFWLHTHFSLPTGVHALLLDMESLQMRMVRNPGVRPLEYRGGTHKRMIEYIAGVECSNPQAHGKITT